MGVDRDRARLQYYVENAHSPTTQREYADDFRKFEAWCAARRACAMPATAALLAEYLAYLAPRYAPTTLLRRAQGISAVHVTAGFPSLTLAPQVLRILQGIRRVCKRRRRGMRPLYLRDVARMVAPLLHVRDYRLRRHALRDRAVILVGWRTGMRRSELVALDVEHIRFSREGMSIHIPRSKTDPFGDGQDVVVPFARRKSLCAVRALRLWLVTVGITSGPVFPRFWRWGFVSDARMTAHWIYLIVKRRAVAAGIDPTLIGAHSLRVGVVSELWHRGATFEDCMRVTRHRDPRSILHYVKGIAPFRHHPLKRLGL